MMVEGRKMDSTDRRDIIGTAGRAGRGSSGAYRVAYRASRKRGNALSRVRYPCWDT